MVLFRQNVVYHRETNRRIQNEVTPHNEKVLLTRCPPLGLGLKGDGLGRENCRPAGERGRDLPGSLYMANYKA